MLLRSGVRAVRASLPTLTDICLLYSRVWHDREHVASAFQAGARFYTCGSLRVAQGIKEVFTKILGDFQLTDKGISADSMWAKIQNVRYAADVFG